MKKIILIGYSGHAFVVYSIFKSGGIEVIAYCDCEEKPVNPFGLPYLGNEKSDAAVSAISANNFFISIGDNSIRRKIFEQLNLEKLSPVNAVHSSAIICPAATIANSGVMISAGVIINSLAKIGTGTICNTGAIIEHECVIGDFAHIGPGAVLCGNVSVGENSFVGAGSVIRQGIHVGSNVMIGAGSVVVKDIPDNAVVKGCPAK